MAVERLTNRMVRDGALDNRRAVETVTPEPDESAHAADFAERLERARRLRPPPGQCQDCGIHGRDETVRAAKAGGLEAARKAEPTAREYRHRLADWYAMREAVVAELTG